MEPNAADALPQPEWNDPDSIARALQSLRDAHDEASAHEACDQFLWAVGDNHEGTFYPVVLAVLADLERLLIDGGAWTQRAVLESLIDLGGTFVPAPGYAVHDGVAVQGALKAAVHAMRPHVLALLTGSDARSASAADLIELLDDQAA